jgi:hypothetical protein
MLAAVYARFLTAADTRCIRSELPADDARSSRYWRRPGPFSYTAQLGGTLGSGSFSNPVGIRFDLELAVFAIFLGGHETQ